MLSINLYSHFTRVHRNLHAWSKWALVAALLPAACAEPQNHSSPLAISNLELGTDYIKLKELAAFDEWAAMAQVQKDKIESILDLEIRRASELLPRKFEITDRNAVIRLVKVIVEEEQRITFGTDGNISIGGLSNDQTKQVEDALARAGYKVNGLLSAYTLTFSPS